jgi:hypothetical protein
VISPLKCARIQSVEACPLFVTQEAVAALRNVAGPGARSWLPLWCFTNLERKSRPAPAGRLTASMIWSISDDLFRWPPRSTGLCEPRRDVVDVAGVPEWA